MSLKIVDNAVDAHLGAPEAVMNSFSRVQFAEAQGTPKVNAQHTEKGCQSRCFVLPMWPQSRYAPSQIVVRPFLGSLLLWGRQALQLTRIPIR
jgi:hypothetical protein